MKLVRGMRVLVAVQLLPTTWTLGTPSSPSYPLPTIVPLRLVTFVREGDFTTRRWGAANKQGIVLADISPEDEGVTWVRGWTKTTERARALQAALALT